MLPGNSNLLSQWMQMMFTCLGPNPDFWCMLTWTCHACCQLPYRVFSGACSDIHFSSPTINRYCPDWICVSEQPVCVRTVTNQIDKNWTAVGLFRLQNDPCDVQDSNSCNVKPVCLSDIAKPTALVGLGLSWCFCYRLGFSRSEVWSEK